VSRRVGSELGHVLRPESSDAAWDQFYAEAGSCSQALTPLERFSP
jgi:hypothetical protein